MKIKSKPIRYLLFGIALDLILVVGTVLLVTIFSVISYEGKCPQVIMLDNAYSSCTFSNYLALNLLFALLAALVMWWIILPALLLPPLIGLGVGFYKSRPGLQSISPPRIFLLIAICAIHPGCASKSATSNSNGNTSPPANGSPVAAPEASSGVVAVALIVYEQPQPPFTIDTLMTDLQKRLPYPCSRTEWVGLTTRIPQIRIDGPTPIFLQINDDPEAVPAESEELAPAARKVFGPDIATKIARCRVRLEVLTGDSKPEVKGKSIKVDATTQVDPSVAPVKDVLKAVADTVHGYVFDTVNGKWQYAAP